MSTQPTEDRQLLAEQLYETTGQSVARCYQCGKCSAGCPLSDETDHPPSQVLRMLQYGKQELDEKALRSLMIWLCLTCQTCSARCPQEVDLPRVMDFLREKSYQRDLVNPDARTIVAFHRSFLASIRATGRMFEIGVILDYKRRTLKLFQDLLMAPRLLIRGKLGFLPHRIKDRADLARVFAKASAGRSGTK